MSLEMHRTTVIYGGAKARDKPERHSDTELELVFQRSRTGSAGNKPPRWRVRIRVGRQSPRSVTLRLKAMRICCQSCEVSYTCHVLFESRLATNVPFSAPTGATWLVCGQQPKTIPSNFRVKFLIQ